MAWPKKVPMMTIKGGGKGLMSITKAPGAGSGPGASLTLPHPDVAHLQAHVGQVFGSGGAPKPRSPMASSTPRGATSAGGSKLAPSPAAAKIASSMLGGS